MFVYLALIVAITSILASFISLFLGLVIYAIISQKSLRSQNQNLSITKHFFWLFLAGIIAHVLKVVLGNNIELPQFVGNYGVYVLDSLFLPALMYFVYVKKFKLGQIISVKYVFLLLICTLSVSLITMKYIAPLVIETLTDDIQPLMPY